MFRFLNYIIHNWSHDSVGKLGDIKLDGFWMEFGRQLFMSELSTYRGGASFRVDSDKEAR